MSGEQTTKRSTDGYIYDVFISYSRGGASDEWVNRFFKPLLEKHLYEEMGSNPVLFIDREIRIGADWSNDLKNSLLRSRCLLSILSGPYFYSKYCLTEWTSMRERARLLSEKGQGCALVFPIKFGDGEHFSEEAKQIEYADLSNWGFIAPAFQNSPEFVEFERAVKNIATSLWSIIKVVPEWEPDWPFVEIEPPPFPLTALPQPRGSAKSSHTCSPQNRPMRSSRQGR
jgi:TIR domain